MADNSVQGGADTIRDLARQAGTVKTQVFQIDAGGATANAENLITAGQQTAANSLPVVIASNQTGLPNPANTTVSATFTASDAVVAAPIGDGSLVSGSSTAGSIVSLLVPDGFTGWTLLLKNYSNGTVYTEASTNSTTGTDGDWVEVKGRKTGTAVGIESITYTMTANGYYRGNAAGFKYMRARFIGVGGFPTAAFMLSTAQGATFLNSGLPSGQSVIGGVKVTDIGGSYSAAVDSTGSLRTTSQAMQTLLTINTEILRQLTKLQLMQSAMSGISVDDDCIDPALIIY